MKICQFSLGPLRWVICHVRLALGGLVFLLGLNSFAAVPPRPGRIQFSNGEVLEGKISLTPGSELKIHIDGKQIRALELARVREIRFAPAEEKMERRWRFLEAGQTKKEFTGAPYLTRSLLATVFLAGGEKITGHLYTTVFYLESAEKTQKVIVPAKQRGKEGEGADALKYPAMIIFTDAAATAENTIRVRLNLAGITEKTMLAGVTWGALLSLDARQAGALGDYTMPSPLGSRMFLAAKTGQRIIVGWPDEKEAKILSLVQTNQALAEDFFDDRKILGVYWDKPNADIYSLVLMSRRGKTTLDAEKSQPWRLVVQRWKYDEESQRLLLAGRGYFFRGILAKGEALPAVELTPQLCNPIKEGETWVLDKGP